MLLDEGLNECIQPLPRHDIFDAVLADIHTVVCDSTLQGAFGVIMLLHMPLALSGTRRC